MTRYAPKQEFGLLPYTMVGSVPAATAVPADITVPAGEIWKLGSLSVGVTNAAVAASRYAFFQILCDGVNISHEVGFAALTTGLSSRFSSGLTTTQRNVGGVATAWSGGLAGMVLNAGAIIRFGYSNIQAADQFTASVLCYFKWKDYEFKGHEWS